MLTDPIGYAFRNALRDNRLKDRLLVVLTASNVSSRIVHRCRHDTHRPRAAIYPNILLATGVRCGCARLGPLGLNPYLTNSIEHADGASVDCIGLGTSCIPGPADVLPICRDGDARRHRQRKYRSNPDVTLCQLTAPICPQLEQLARLHSICKSLRADAVGPPRSHNLELVQEAARKAERGR